MAGQHPHGFGGVLGIIHVHIATHLRNIAGEADAGQQPHAADLALKAVVIGQQQSQGFAMP